MCALCFGSACHTFGAVFLRALSTFVLVFGLIGTVVLQMTAFYYLGVLNPHPLISTLLYVPSLAAFAVLRSELQKLGTSTVSAIGPPRESHPVTIAYLVMATVGCLSVVHPLWMRMFGYISAQSTWLALFGTALFYYSLLISEVLFASAINLSQARRMGKRGGLYGMQGAAAEMTRGAAASGPPGPGNYANIGAPGVVSAAGHVHAHHSAAPCPVDSGLDAPSHPPHVPSESGPIESFY
jgi:hypothetical protein